jgi:Lon protease-like protein
MDIPLFPLHTVLFPGGRLRLKVFEARYLDMVSERMRAELPFGICLIKSGSEVGGGAEPETVGTLANIVEADMDTPGILMLRVEGGARFVVEHTRIGARPAGHRHGPRQGRGSRVPGSRNTACPPWKC